MGRVIAQPVCGVCDRENITFHGCLADTIKELGPQSPKNTKPSFPFKNQGVVGRVLPRLTARHHVNLSVWLTWIIHSLNKYINTNCEEGSKRRGGGGAELFVFKVKMRVERIYIQKEKKIANKRSEEGDQVSF